MLSCRALRSVLCPGQMSKSRGLVASVDNWTPAMSCGCCDVSLVTQVRLSVSHVKSPAPDKRTIPSPTDTEGGERNKCLFKQHDRQPSNNSACSQLYIKIPYCHHGRSRQSRYTSLLSVREPRADAIAGGKAKPLKAPKKAPKAELDDEDIAFKEKQKAGTDQDASTCLQRSNSSQMRKQRPSSPRRRRAQRDRSTQGRKGSSTAERNRYHFRSETTSDEGQWRYVDMIDNTS